MKGKSILLPTALSLLLSTQFAFASENSAVHEMAKIVMHLNHYPSEGDKAKLKDIATHGSTAEKTMANALLHMLHSVSADDKSKLSAIAHDDALSQHTRDLAGIIANLSHKASAEDKKKLKEM